MKYTSVNKVATLKSVGREKDIVWTNAHKPLNLFKSLSILETLITLIILANWGKTLKIEILEFPLPEVAKVNIMSTQEEQTTTQSKTFQLALK